MATTYKTQVGEIVRDMTQAEITEYELVLADIADKAAAEAAKAAQRQVILDRLGLTADEAQLLLG
jgi:hypothetical protein